MILVARLLPRQQIELLLSMTKMLRACMLRCKSFAGFRFSFVQPTFLYLALAETHFKRGYEQPQETGYHNDDTFRIIAILRALTPLLPRI